MRPRSLLVLLGSTLALAACQEEAPRAAASDRPVLVQRVAFEPRAAERSFVATIRPRVESDLGFRVGGKVASRLVDVGVAVKAGAPLARLDDTDLRLQEEQAEAEIAAARASLVQAEAALDRVAKLKKAGHATAATVEEKDAAAQEARTRLLRAERQVSLARNALAYAVLVADADGVVTAALVEPGQVAAPGQPAIRLARMAEKEAVVAVPEALVAGVRNAKAVLTLWSASDKAFEAELRELSPSADPATRTYLARFSLKGTDDAVRLGMTGTVTLRDPSQGEVARLPLSALHNQGDGPAVWVVGDDGSPVLRPVEVTAYEARDVLIGKGVSAGDRVVTLGVQKLDADAPVRVVEALEF